MKIYEKPYTKKVEIESDEVLAGSQFIDDNNGNDNYPIDGEDNDVPAKFDVWQ